MNVPHYTGTAIPVAEGDIVDFDGRVGKIRLVCLPNSKDAEAYSCSEEGGLLIEFDEFGLVLEPFGFSEEIHLVK